MCDEGNEDCNKCHKLFCQSYPAYITDNKFNLRKAVFPLHPDKITDLPEDQRQLKAEKFKELVNCKPYINNVQCGVKPRDESFGQPRTQNRRTKQQQQQKKQSKQQQQQKKQSKQQQQQKKQSKQQQQKKQSKQQQLQKHRKQSSDVLKKFQKRISKFGHITSKYEKINGNKYYGKYDLQNPDYIGTASIYENVTDNSIIKKSYFQFHSK